MKLHVVPFSIISQGGTKFTSHYWKAFKNRIGTDDKLSIVLSLQTDFQAERTIQTLPSMLRACVINLKGIIPQPKVRRKSTI